MGLVRVGFDGTAGAAAALRWALTTARWHGHEVEALTAVADDASGVVARFGVADHVESIRVAALEAVRARHGGDGQDVVVRSRIVRGEPVASLVEAEPTADLLVVGGRGLGVVAGLVRGSVSQRVVEHAHGPVVVVGEDAGDVEVQRLVVGVDGSGHAARALRWAVAEARARGAVVEVVASHQPSVVTAGVPWVPDLGVVDVVDHRADAQAALEGQLAAVDTRGVALEWSVIEAPAHEALCGRAADAQLLVVGTRGLGGFGSLLLGSTGHRCLHDAPTPVVIVP